MGVFQVLTSPGKPGGVLALRRHAGGHVSKVVEMVFHFCFFSTSVCDLMNWAQQWANNLTYEYVWVKGGERTIESGQILLSPMERGIEITSYGDLEMME